MQQQSSVTTEKPVSKWKKRQFSGKKMSQMNRYYNSSDSSFIGSSFGHPTSMAKGNYDVLKVVWNHRFLSRPEKLSSMIIWNKVISWLTSFAIWRGSAYLFNWNYHNKMQKREKREHLMRPDVPTANELIWRPFRQDLHQRFFFFLILLKKKNEKLRTKSIKISVLNWESEKNDRFKVGEKARSKL